MKKSLKKVFSSGLALTLLAAAAIPCSAETIGKSKMESAPVFFDGEMALKLICKFDRMGDVRQNGDELRVTEKETTAITEINEENVKSVICSYYGGRAAFLKKSAFTFSAAVPAIVTDEGKHLDKLNCEDICILNSTFEIGKICCEKDEAHAEVQETITYLSNRVISTEEVQHTVTLYLDSEERLIVVSDTYIEEYSGFHSCAYVLPVEEGFDIESVSGSKMCILNIAYKEKGTKETTCNDTKYNEWFAKGNRNPWCAIFVAWCAEQAHVSTSIIPRYESAGRMKNFFEGKNQFFESQSQGGTKAPQPGDLFFTGTSTSKIRHVGFVRSVDSNNIYVVDGNCRENGVYQVRTHSISRTDSELVGFATPKYESTAHSCGGNWCTNGGYHWKVCSICDEQMQKNAHTYGTWQKNSYYHWKQCSVCGEHVQKNAHTYGTWQKNGYYHWKVCSVCGEQTQKNAHTYKKQGGCYVCTTCGYKATTIPGVSGIGPFGEIEDTIEIPCCCEDELNHFGRTEQ